MDAHVGIDVGGTFTDAVLMEGNKILCKTKVPTCSEDILTTLLKALEDLGSFEKVKNITVSTTLVTNAILQDKLPPVEMILFPGSGMKLESLPWPVRYHTLKGEVDYRGRMVVPTDELEWRRLLNTIDFNKIRNVAIISKFSHRNKVLEEDLEAYLRKRFGQLNISLGHHWGKANFYRRSLTTLLNLGCDQLYSNFAVQLQKAVKAKGIEADISVLKADGGILPLEKVRPVESIYSGPAASVLGAMAQSDPSESYVVVDVGGTTTDIGLVLSGEPLLSTRGAKIGAFATQVPTLAVHSIAVGGDSTILASWQSPDGFEIAPSRIGPAQCLGGSAPTPTDAMCYLGLIPYGDYDLAEKALFSLLPDDSQSPILAKAMAEKILYRVSEKIHNAIQQIENEWRQEPAYKIWEVLHAQSKRELSIWLSGGGAQGLSQVLEKHLHRKVYSSKYTDVSNAIGTALARATFTCTLHLDTSIRRYRIEESGEQGDWFGSKRPHKEVEKFLRDVATRMLEEWGIEATNPKIQPFDFFPVVKGYETVGQVVRGSLVVPPGVRGRVEL